MEFEIFPDIMGIDSNSDNKLNEEELNFELEDKEKLIREIFEETEKHEYRSLENLFHPLETSTQYL